MQVLIVDDSVSARFSLKRSLERFGITVEAASSAEDGIALLGTMQFDAIFMDHVLPQMDGLQAVSTIRRMDAYRTTPIIMCSSNDDAAYIEKAMNAGANSVIRKPPEPEQLETVVAALRGGRMVTPEQESPPDFTSTQEVPVAVPQAEEPAADTAPGVEFEAAEAPADIPTTEAEPDPNPVAEPDWSPGPAAEPDEAPAAAWDAPAPDEASAPEVIVTETEAEDTAEFDVQSDLDTANPEDETTTVVSSSAVRSFSEDDSDSGDAHRVEVKIDTRELKRLVAQLDGITQRLAAAEDTLQRIEQLAASVDRLQSLEQSLNGLLESVPARLDEAARGLLAERLQAAAAALGGTPDPDA